MSLPRVRLVTSRREIAVTAAEARKQDGDRLILVPIDFSAHSEGVLLHACELGAELPAALVVLHVVHDPGEMPGYYSKLIKKKRAGRIQDTAAQVFEEFMENMIDSHPDLEVLRRAEPMLVVGLPVTRILEVVDVVDPFMVVVGSQGRTGLKHVLIGSKALQLVQLCPVPITVVKTRKKKSKARDTD
jgi:nucleotide-binding universal stress UspA family protein